MTAATCIALLWLKVSSLLCVCDRACSWLQLGFLTPSYHGLFPCSEGQSSFNPAVLLVVRVQRINHRCPAQRQGKAVNKFKRGPRCCPERESQGSKLHCWVSRSTPDHADWYLLVHRPTRFYARSKRCVKVLCCFISSGRLVWYIIIWPHSRIRTNGIKTGMGKIPNTVR